MFIHIENKSFSSSKFRPAILSNYVKFLEGPDLVRHLRYTLSHISVSNTSGLRIRSITTFGSCYAQSLDLNSAGKDALDPDGVVSSFFTEMSSVIPGLRWIGKKVYLRHQSPSFNEDFPSARSRESALGCIPPSAFALPFESLAGARIEADDSDTIHDNINSAIAIIQSGISSGQIPCSSAFNPVDRFSNAVRILNEQRFDRSIRAKDRGIYTDLLSYRETAEGERLGCVVNVGRVRKSVFYGAPTHSKLAGEIFELSRINEHVNGRTHLKNPCVRHLCRKIVMTKPSVHNTVKVNPPVRTRSVAAAHPFIQSSIGGYVSG